MAMKKAVFERERDATERELSFEQPPQGRRVDPLEATELFDVPAALRQLRHQGQPLLALRRFVLASLSAMSHLLAAQTDKAGRPSGRCGSQNAYLQLNSDAVKHPGCLELRVDVENQSLDMRGDSGLSKRKRVRMAASVPKRKALLQLLLYILADNRDRL
jgi:hypothetical protein